MIKKCILLAAGLGTRLKPLTNHTPKCLVKIQGKPLLDYWLNLLYKHGITNVLINTHHLSEQVVKFINSVDTPLEVQLSYEKELLGSLGTIIYNKNFYKDDESVLVINADNLTNMNLSRFIECHLSHNLDASIGLMETENPSECGIVEMDFDNNIIGYEEKPIIPKTNISNAGVYLFNTIIFRNLEASCVLNDIGNDLLPNLVGRSYGYLLDEFLIDIGSLSALEKAREKIQIL
jgi:mannose-1-phosphate guanylyltransferase